MNDKTEFKFSFTKKTSDGSYIKVQDDDMQKCLDEMETFMRAIDSRFQVQRTDQVDQAVAAEAFNARPAINPYWPCKEHGTTFGKKSKKGTMYCDKCFQAKKARGELN